MTLGQLARILGLSKTTVSRALAGYDDVSAATRARVREAAVRYGYEPNALAQTLRSGRAGAIGAVIPTSCGGLSSPFFLDLLLSASAELESRGLNLLLASAPPHPDPAELTTMRRMVEGKRIDAAIVGQTRRHDPRVAYLQSRGLPFVCHGRTESPQAYAFVDMDGERAFRLAGQRLVDLGHRRIAYIGTSSDLFTYAAHRRRGYLAALEAAGLAVDPALLVEGEGGEAFGRAAADVLLARPDPPTALLCATDLEAVGALQAIHAAGLQAGREVSVIGHDDLPLSRHTDPPLTTIGQAYAAIGTRLVEILMELLKGTQPGALQETWAPELVIRASDGPPPGRR